MTVEERVQLLEEAGALERAGGTWRIRHVMAVLDVARSSVYRSRWLMQRRIKRGQGKRAGNGWHPRDVRLFQAMQSGKDPLQRPQLRRAV